MTLLFFDGFDNYGTLGGAFANLYKLYSASFPYGGLAVRSGRFGGYALGDDQTNSTQGGYLAAPAPLATPVATAIVGARFSWGGSATSSLFVANSSGQSYVTASVSGSSGICNVTIKNNQATIGSGTIAVASGSDCEFELQCALDRTNGAVIFKYNGAAVPGLTLTNVNTLGSLTNEGIYYAGPTAAASSFSYCVFDDLYICDTTGSGPDNTFLTALCGPMGPRSGLLVPTSDGTTMQWPPSSGSSGHAAINKTSWTNTPYISASAPGQEAQFGVGTINASNILALQTEFVGVMNDAGLVEVNDQLIVAGTVTAGPTRTFTSNQQKFTEIYTTDPTTGLPWAPSQLSTAGVIEIGVKRTV
jgi:hypothetical protein